MKNEEPRKNEERSMQVPGHIYKLDTHKYTQSLDSNQYYVIAVCHYGVKDDTRIRSRFSVVTAYFSCAGSCITQSP